MFGDWGTGSVPVREQRARSEEINVQVTRATNGLLDGAVILVADDNAEARLLIRKLLERCRATVMSASTATRISASLTEISDFVSDRNRTSRGTVGVTASRVAHQMFAGCPGTSVASIAVCPFSDFRLVMMPGWMLA